MIRLKPEFDRLMRLVEQGAFDLLQTERSGLETLRSGGWLTCVSGGGYRWTDDAREWLATLAATQ